MLRPLVAVAVMVLAGVGALAAQGGGVDSAAAVDAGDVVDAAAEPATPPGSISGTIVDAATSTAIGGAVVALVPEQPAVVPAGPGAAAVWARGNDVTTTAPDGSYRFTEVASGRYTIRVDGLGYRGATVRIQLDGGGASRVSVGLAVEPIRLRPVDVRGEPRDLLHGDVDVESAVGLSRLAAIRLRQARHLPTDVRVLVTTT